jgi:hypothetical protein
MLRTILGVVIGYVVMFALVFLTLMLVFMSMGPEWSFEPNSFEASTGWIAMSFVANLAIGIIGGLLCSLIANEARAPLSLAVLVFVLGMLLAIPAIVAQESTTNLARHGEVTQLEAMENAREPLWVPFTFPFVGAIGVLIGGKVIRRN